MRLSFADEAHEEITCGREYTPIPASALADRSCCVAVRAEVGLNCVIQPISHRTAALDFSGPFVCPNAATSAVSAAYRARGVSFGVVSACASSAHAIGLAAQAIRWGQADVMFAGAPTRRWSLNSIRAWEAMRVLAIDNDHPERACRPFSADRRGLVLAEGAAVFVLESLQHAARRGARIIGAIAGFGASSDAGHITDPSTEGAARAIAAALHDGRLSPP